MSLPDPGEWPIPADDAVDTILGDDTVDLLRRRASATPDRTALIDANTGEATTCAALDRQVDRVAAALDEMAHDDSPIGILFGTRPAFARVYFAAGRLGGVAVPLNTELSNDVLADQASRAGIDALVCDSATASIALEVAPFDAALASVDESDDPDVQTLPATDTEATDDPTIEPARLHPDDDRLILFTSGTTGRPKGVRLTLGNLVASAVGSADRLGVSPADRWLVTLPMYHMGGLAPLVRSTLYGTTTVVQRRFDAETTDAVLDERAVTGVSLVPTMLTRLLDAGWAPTDRLRFVLLGGAPAGADLLERALDRGVPVYPTYGATETASQVTTATPAEVASHSGTVGRPLSVTDVSIQGDDGTPVRGGYDGEIVVSGPTVSVGYLDGDRTAESFRADGFHTGDVGYRDDGGRLWVVGRVDDRIVTGGENVSPGRVTDALRGHDGVANAAVVGLPDDEWGERVAALVVRDDESITGEQIRDHVHDEVASFAAPKTVAFADSLPRTASGTVDRDAVTERLRDVDDETDR